MFRDVEPKLFLQKVLYNELPLLVFASYVIFEGRAELHLGNDDGTVLARQGLS